jgi:alpha-L-rhamnosidase
MYGRIETSWKREGSALTLKVRVPANSSATVYVPAGDASKVTESGVVAAHANGVKYLRSENGTAVYEVGAGTYAFETAD